jgi:four helix bundle protein
VFCVGAIMTNIRGFKELQVWQKAMNLADQIYSLTDNFPQIEMYGLASQIRRSAVSIPSNIAEGCARNGTKEFIQFLGIAKGSLAELETRLLLARRRNYLNEEHMQQINMQIREVDNFIFSLITKLRSKLKAPTHNT